MGKTGWEGTAAAAHTAANATTADKHTRIVHKAGFLSLS